jgi:hypothetical protein
MVLMLSDSKLIRKENRTDGREAVSIEIYNGLFMSTLAFIILHRSKINPHQVQI